MKSMDRTQVDPAHAGGQSSSEPPPQLRTIGLFRILRRLGEGGMGAVYLAYDDQNHRPVAIKILSETLAADEKYVNRFKREAHNSALLNHPSIVRGLDVGQDEATGLHFLVLEYVDGPNAHALLDKLGKFPVGDAVHIILDVARALEHAHSRNIIHRDIKPDNILLTRSGVAKLSDLGLAKQTNVVSTLTSHKQSFGTPYYMPFEQALDARNADHRSDIFALGATFYHLLTGDLPFPGENPVEIAELKSLGEFAPARSHNPAVPLVLDQIIAKMLARHPGDRYQTASELIVDLERTQLAEGVPSFADPEQALLDPYVRERMASSAQPTQPDLTPPVVNPAPAPAADLHWHVRYRNAEGKLRRVQMSARGLEQKVRQGKLPPDAEISQDPSSAFQLLSEVEPFRALLPTSTTLKPRTGLSHPGKKASGARTGSKRRKLSSAVAAVAALEAPAQTRYTVWFYSFLTASLLLVLSSTLLYLLYIR